VQRTQKELEKAVGRTDKLDKPIDCSLFEEELVALAEAVLAERDIGKRLQEAKDRQDQAAEQVRGGSDDYHPCDRETGQPVTAEEVGKRLNDT